MNKKELVQFVKWLQSNVESFAEKTPEQVVESLNEMTSTSEGQQEFVKLVDSWKKSTSKYRTGGKIDLLINKFQTGTDKVNPELKARAEQWANATFNKIKGGDQLTLKMIEKTSNPYDATAIRKAVLNFSGNRKSNGAYSNEDIVETMGLVMDSLARRGYDKSTIKNVAGPIYKEYIYKSLKDDLDNSDSRTSFESSTPRQIKLEDFLYPNK